MREELVRINSIDWIEQPGILYTPDKETNKIVIHIHGLNWNFYENRFLDILAKSYTDKNYAFLTFNNRWRWFITELLKGDDFITIGWSLERFKDCILDIQGVINRAKEYWFKEIILEWHSYWCNKILYYYNNIKDNCIKKIVLLAPCDIPAETKKFLSKEEYEKTKKESTRLVNESKENELIDFPAMANWKISAGTFFYDFLPNWDNDFIRYSDWINWKSEILNKINIPTLIIFWDHDECVLTQPIDIVKSYLKNNIKKCDIEIIENTNHLYTNKLEKLWKIIKKNL